jgi:hypothetical protein
MKEETILGAGDGVESELIALYDGQAPVTNDNSPVTKTQVLGKLSVVTYDEIVKDLVIVPVNGNKYPYSEDALRAQLNKIYGQAVVKWNITFASNFDLPGIDPFDDGGSGLLSNYSPDMRKVVSAYKANLQRNTHYLFLVKNPKSGTDGTVSMAGFMPRSKECGFIFVDKNGSEESIIRTMAHELGHGVFHLRHTFDKEEKNMLPEKGTDNLMDYANGNKLFKYQWDRMRYPEIVMGLFEDDDAGKYETDGHYSTVYLTCLLLGMEVELARELATLAEAPDTDILGEFDFVLDETWGYLGDQQDIHSLTGGFHGVEEMMTAFKFLYTPPDKKEILGKLLHRYADTYAHTKLNSLFPEILKNYEFGDDETKLTLYINAWKDQKGPKIDTRIEPWIQFLNKQINIHGYRYFSSTMLQKMTLNGKNLVQYLHSIYLNQPPDKFKMYGDAFYTLDHAATDGSLPDYIYIRPNWYLTYVKNLGVLISYKYNLNINRLDMSVFNQMVDFAKKNQCKLKGIIDFEISKILKSRYVIIPVYYPGVNRVLATADALLKDYLDEANVVKDWTLKYMQDQGLKNLKVKEIKESFRGSSIEKLKAYKIEY